MLKYRSVNLVQMLQAFVIATPDTINQLFVGHYGINEIATLIFRRRS